MRELCAARDGAWAGYPVRAKKAPRRVEELTVFALNCCGKLALRQRPEHGLLAGLWELPNVPGHLDAQAALDLAADWGVKPRNLVKQLEREHIFTHIVWKMRCCVLECAAEAPGFVWADEASLDRQYALPTAFRMFRADALDD